MAEYMLIYKGDATDMEDMTPEQGAAVMAAWGEWIGKLGDQLHNVGTPFGPGSSLVDDGSSGTPESLTGFSIVTADSMADARAHANGHPYLSEGLGNYSIDIYELMPVPF
jgi:hypothetical protein